MGTIMAMRPGAQLRPARKVAVFLCVFILLLCLTAGAAWSFETHALPGADVPPAAQANSFTKSSPTSGAGDTCLPLLKNIRFEHPTPATDFSRHSAGKAAALGVVFGVRFALGPKRIARAVDNDSTLKPYIGTPSGGAGPHALAVADYRRCANERAMKALSDWRWAR